MAYTVSMEEETTLPPKMIDPKDVSRVDSNILQLLKKPKSNESAGITPFGDGMILVHPAQFFYVLYGKNPSCWRPTWIESNGAILMGLELINTDSLEVKGMVEMKVFRPGQKYAVYFWIQMKKNAKFDTLCRFTLVVADRPDASVLASTLDLKELEPDELEKVRVGEFKATDKKGEVRFSLINFDAKWKSGMILAGVFFQPIYY